MEKQKEHGFFNNFIYALNIERKSNLRLLAITLIKPIGDIVGTLLNSYAPKYVLSFIEDDLPFNTIIMYTVIICLIMMILDVISTTCTIVSSLNIERQKAMLKRREWTSYFILTLKTWNHRIFLIMPKEQKQH